MWLPCMCEPNYEGRNDVSMLPYTVCLKNHKIRMCSYRPYLNHITLLNKSEPDEPSIPFKGMVAM